MPGNFLRNINPAGAVGELMTELRTPYPHRFKIMALAAAMTVAIFSVMAQEGGAGLPKPPEVIYVDQLDPNRTEAEIVAGNIAATQASRARQAEAAARDERVRQLYKTLGRATGMDVEAIEAKARAEQAAEAQRRASEEAAKPKARVARVNE